MSATRLTARRIEKPWGRHTLWPGFADAADAPIGEIWFETSSEADPELLVKYLFTSERLSIQVHPDDVAAQAAGYSRGKDEAWIVLAAEPGATIGIGLTRDVSPQALRDAALDGSIEALLDWRPVKVGDVIYSPAGTVHAIGAGLTLIEVQQNLDLTYRLYDYGRPRELHLDAGVAVAVCGPFALPSTQVQSLISEVDASATDSSATKNPKRLLVGGPKLIVYSWKFRRQLTSIWPDNMPRWFIPVIGGGCINDMRYEAGECWLVYGAMTVEQDEGSEVLIAMPNSSGPNL